MPPQVYFPYLLMSKKRYAGLLWTVPEKWDKMDTKVRCSLAILSVSQHRVTLYCGCWVLAIWVYIFVGYLGTAATLTAPQCFSRSCGGQVSDFLPAYRCMPFVRDHASGLAVVSMMI